MTRPATNFIGPMRPPIGKDGAPLSPQHVRYIVLEGGGGKGFAFLGAIDVLEELQKDGIMQKPLGYGGSSAGAITALMLSLGMNADEIAAFLREEHFSEFFDKPRCKLDFTPDKEEYPVVPMPFLGARALRYSDKEEYYISLSKNASITDAIKNLAVLKDGGFVSGPAAIAIAFLPSAIDTLLNHTLPDEIRIHGLGSDGSFSLDTMVRRAKKSADSPDIIKRFCENIPEYLVQLRRDFGLFSGLYARQAINKIINSSIKKLAASHGTTTKDLIGLEMADNYSLTFGEHYVLFRNKLIVTGTNLSRGTTQLFSVDETPKFPVADAVRISMGLPWIYKPYTIPKDIDGWPKCGVYCDGGYFNNLPYRAFDRDHRLDQIGWQYSNSVAPARTATLGLRLEIVPPFAIQSIFDFAKSFIQFGFFGAGESQVIDGDSDQILTLDTEGLSLLEFNPPTAVRDVVRKRSRRDMWRYFSMPDRIRADDRVQSDETASEKRRQNAEACAGNTPVFQFGP